LPGQLRDASAIRLGDTVPQPNGDVLVLAETNGKFGSLFRLQGAAGGPDGPVTISGRVVTVTGTADVDVVDALVDVSEGNESGPLSIRVGGNFGRVFDRADVDTVIINAGGGNDWIAARPGLTIHASVNGGDGNDTLLSGPGNDSLFGEAGRDFLEGFEGNDLLEGGASRDHIAGGDGNDTLRGGASGDYLNGQGGNDILLGQGGADRLDGGDGADTISGNAGNDFFNNTPDSAADHIYGDGGFDEVFFRDSGDVLVGVESLTDVT
jgi:Ca2+-binding RTX toxin-like protein